MQTIVKENENGLLSAHSTWERVRLVDVCKILNGFAFPSSQFAASTGVPLLRIRDVTKDTTQTNFAGEYDPQYLVETGDLVMGMDGDFNAALWRGPRALLNQRVCRLTLDEKFYSKRFLAYAIQGYLNAINAKTSAITVKHLSSRTVAEIPLPLPPLAEQNAVVALLDAMMTRLDATVALLERAQKNLKRYRASVLKAAIEGRLVPTEAELAKREGRNYEPASELLKRILVERRKKWIENAAEKARAKAKEKARKAGKPWTDADDVKTLEKERAKAAKKYKEPATPDTSNLPDLPEGWCWTSLGQLAWLVKDGPHYSPKYVDDGIPFITGGNVRPEGVDFDGAKRISPKLHSELCSRIEPKLGDILYTKGGTTGIARVNTYDRAFNVWVHVAVLRLAQPIDPFYVQNALNSPWCYSQSQMYTHGVGNQDLGLTRMVNITVPLPPLQEQSRINKAVALTLSVLVNAASSMESAGIRSQALRQSILKWAFEGKLVEQNPNDEPSSSLLERIKVERSASRRYR
jgi:type I restriction enzyme S subunit